MLQLNSAVGVCASSGVDVLISKESRGGGKYDRSGRSEQKRNRRQQDSNLRPQRGTDRFVVF